MRRQSLGVSSGSMLFAMLLCSGQDGEWVKFSHQVILITVIKWDGVVYWNMNCVHSHSACMYTGIQNDILGKVVLSHCTLTKVYLSQQKQYRTTKKHIEINYRQKNKIKLKTPYVADVLFMDKFSKPPHPTQPPTTLTKHICILLCQCRSVSSNAKWVY